MAGTQFDQNMNLDAMGIKTPAVYSSDINEWMMLSGNHVKKNGVWVPQTVDADGKTEIRAAEIETLLTALGGKDFATQATVKAILDKIIAAPASEAKQDILNNLVGEVQDNPTTNTLLSRLKSLEDKIDNITSGTSPAAVQLSGSNVEIGGVTFAVSGGDTLRNTAANKPDAVAAHAVIPYCYYFSIDTGVVEATDGTNWVVI